MKRNIWNTYNVVMIIALMIIIIVAIVQDRKTKRVFDELDELRLKNDKELIEYKRKLWNGEIDIDGTNKPPINSKLYKYFPKEEVEIISSVAYLYELNEHQTDLLFCIRRIENSGCLRINEHGVHVSGKPNGLQFGVGDGIDNHPARRYAGDFKKSLRLQAMWAAGTIKKRYKEGGSIEKLAGRYCATNKINWERMVRSWLQKIS